MTVEDLVYWIYESGAANGKYIRADRKPISPDEAAAQINQLIQERERLARVDELRRAFIELDLTNHAQATYATDRLKELSKEPDIKANLKADQDRINSKLPTIEEQP